MKVDDFVKLTKSPRADIPAPQYCRVVTVIGQDIVVYCFSLKAYAEILTFLRRGEYERKEKTEYSEKQEEKP